MIKDLVSVIMPVYNAKEYIKEAIESILNQTYNNFELLIINDCSTDNTMDVVYKIKDDRIRILNNSHNCGVAYSRNRGLEESRGEYIAIMDDDDIAMPYRFEMQVSFLKQNMDFDVVGGKFQFIDQQGNIIRDASKAYYNPNFIKAHLIFRNCFCNSEVMFRSEVLGNLRYVDGCLGMEDFRFWIELSKYTKMYMIDEVFLQHRIHQSKFTERIKAEKAIERADKYAELQELSWNLSGIHLSKQDSAVLHKYISEDSSVVCESPHELKLLYKALENFLTQCKSLEFYNEIEIICRREFIRNINKVTKLWDIY